MSLALTLGAIVFGAALQRVTGMGFALAASPILVLLLGPVDGVVLTNVCAVFSAAIVMFGVWREIDWRRFLVFTPAALVGIVPGAWVATRVEPAPLNVIIGACVVVGMTLSVLASRARAISGAAPAVGFGLASGFMSVTAGVGGPAFSVYAIAARWPHRVFVATAQPTFLMLAAASLAAKAVAGVSIVGIVPWWTWVAAIVMIVIGVAAGGWIARRIGPVTARGLLIGIAYFGGVALLVKGIVEMLAA